MSEHLNPNSRGFGYVRRFGYVSVVAMGFAAMVLFLALPRTDRAAVDESSIGKSGQYKSPGGDTVIGSAPADAPR